MTLFLALVGCAALITDEDLCERFDCDETDTDGDGFEAAVDCDDDDASVYPGAPEVLYDGIDQDCAGDSDYDGDGDGYDSASYGGGDCDDADPDTYPGAPDEPYDGVVTDCDEADEFDADGDGFDSEDYAGNDCDDSNSSVYPGADDEPYDGVDADCDGSSEFDLDGDGHDAEPWGDDCDDTDPEVHPGHEEDDPAKDNDCDGEVEAGPVSAPDIDASSSLRVCDELQLDGTGSYDRDGGPVDLVWELTTAPATSTLATADLEPDAGDPQPTLRPDVIGDYTFTLWAYDEDGLEDSDQVVATIKNRSNTAPSADAGDSQTVSSSATTGTPCSSKSVTLDGNASTDSDDDILEYAWAIVDGPGSGASWSATLSDEYSATPTLTIAGVRSMSQGSYGIEEVDVELTVTDCMGDTSTDTVRVTYTCMGL